MGDLATRAGDEVGVVEEGVAAAGDFERLLPLNDLFDLEDFVDDGSRKETNATRACLFVSSNITTSQSSLHFHVWWCCLFLSMKIFLQLPQKYLAHSKHVLDEPDFLLRRPAPVE